ncbi:hypothetical protein LTR84_011336 [Exophiala bonariae]|uniref:Uncharacterized protein n=1 Tax=Exophiala bonariae TaxID=1690606 RepID=A0AAV9MSH4_9EURO|nr:hypothetical protein LTR84_011336 [Exophiala bonariae]
MRIGAKRPRQELESGITLDQLSMSRDLEQASMLQGDFTHKNPEAMLGISQHGTDDSWSDRREHDTACEEKNWAHRSTKVTNWSIDDAETTDLELAEMIQTVSMVVIESKKPPRLSCLLDENEILLPQEGTLGQD